VNGVVTTVNWNVTNGDACAGFDVSTDLTTGTFLPYVTTTTPQTSWYWYKGAPMNGSFTQKSVDADATITVETVSAESDLSEQIKVYGPVVDTTVEFYEPGESCHISGAVVSEYSGQGNGIGIVLTNPKSFPTMVPLLGNAPGFPFDPGYIQLCNMLMEGPFLLSTTNGNWCLDNTYPTYIGDFVDEPMYSHVTAGVSDSATDNFQWTGACKSHNNFYSIWATCANADWHWYEENAYAWLDPTGGVTDTGIIFGFTKPLEWSYLFTNRGGK